MRISRIIIFCAFLMSAFSVDAQVRLPALFSDNAVLQQQMEIPVWGWGEKNSDIRIVTSWNDKSYLARTDETGRWKVKITTPEAGGPYNIQINQDDEIRVIQNILIGEVWLGSGQSNMEMPLKGFPGQPVKNGNETIVKADNDQIRLITVPRASEIEPQEDFDGQWEEVSPATVADFSATAWYFGQLLQEVLEVPVGLIHVSYGGSNVEAWMNEQMLKDFSEISVPENEEEFGDPNRTATALFNGMLAPVVGYGIRGVIWYQGESNYDRPEQYQSLFPTMVESWREIWDQGNFPFYFAQIAPFDYSQFTPNQIIEKNNSAYIREAQLMASKKIPNSGMAVLMDVGEKNNIHPAQKRKGGERLALLALANTYGQKGFEFSSPEFEAMEIKGSNVVVAFANAPNGITSYGKEVRGFEIAGENKVFYPATAVLRRKSVLLSSPQVENPLAVRYLFKDFAEAELFSTGGLPVSSFRTDDW